MMHHRYYLIPKNIILYPYISYIPYLDTNVKQNVLPFTLQVTLDFLVLTEFELFHLSK